MSAANRVAAVDGADVIGAIDGAPVGRIPTLSSPRRTDQILLAAAKRGDAEARGGAQQLRARGGDLRHLCPLRWTKRKPSA
jgi:hypothetical protein